MRKYFLTTQSAVLAFLLGMLGIMSCGNQPNEYGCPHATYIIKGHIKSESTGNAIQNIRIFNDQYDSTYSDTNGYYVLTMGSKKTNLFEFVLHLRDIDSTQNGNFQNQDTTVVFDNPLFTNGDGHWDKGETSKEFDVKLKPKN